MQKLFAFFRQKTKTISKSSREQVEAISEPQPNSLAQLLLAADSATKQGDRDRALTLYATAIALKPDESLLHYKRGNLFKDAGDLRASLDSYERAIVLEPASAVALCNRGVVLERLNRLEEARASYDRAIDANPKDSFAYYNRAGVLRALSRPKDALESYNLAIGANTEYAEAYCNRGVLLAALKQWDRALADYDRCIELRAGFSKAYFNKGTLLKEIGLFEAALTNFDKAIETQPDYSEAYCNRGILLSELGRWDAAFKNFEQAVALNSSLPEAYAGRADVLLKAGRFEEAVANYDEALRLKSDLRFVLGSQLHAKMNISDWHGFGSDIKRLTAAIESDAPASPPLYVVVVLDSLVLQRKTAEIWVRETCAADHSLPKVSKHLRSEKIRVGYFSADFREHATAHLLAGLVDVHDRSKFEITGFSFGPDTKDRYRKRLEAAFDQFFDVQAKSNLEIASLARHLNLDIAVDLHGHTRGSRTGVFALRSAPLQVNFLGYPGTMGADYIDYMIADETVVQPQYGRHFAEKIIYLPHSYQINDSKRLIADRVFSRTELGLPAQGFVFCCFNSSYKIVPNVFETWMRILRQTPASVLWLLGNDATVVNNLQQRAHVAGIEPGRLIFAKRMSPPEHLARQRAADLFLDNLPCNAHTTASEALWAGLPLLTCSGESFASRVAASLLKAIDLPELIAPTQERYEQMAVELASDPQRLLRIRRKLADNRLTTPLFDTRLYAMHLEAAYAIIYERYQNDLPPSNIKIMPSFKPQLIS